MFRRPTCSPLAPSNARAVFEALIGLFASGSFLTDEMLDLAASGLGTRYLKPVQLVENTVDWSLEDRGLLENTLVVWMGEFGRTPKINKNAGRDHWPQVSCALLAGGGMRTGQVIGATNTLGEHATDRPVHFQEIFATLYHNLGLDAHRDRIFDGSGTPRYPVDAEVEPIRELLEARVDHRLRHRWKRIVQVPDA